MKKSIYIVLNLFLLIKFIFSESCPFFSYSLSYNQVHDYNTGINVERLDDYENLYNKNKVKKMVINVIRDDCQDYFEKHYNNGILVRDITHVHEYSDDILRYNEKGYLLKYGDNFTYNYISDSKRECFFRREKISEQEIFNDIDYLKITKQNFSKREDTEELVKSARSMEEYFYEGGRLVRYEERNWFKKDMLYNFIKKIFLYYDDNNRLVKIVSGYNEDDIRDIFYIFYDEDGNILEIEDKIGEESCYTVKFLQYDKYGNWHRQEIFRKGKRDEITVRDIFYIDYSK